MLFNPQEPIIRQSQTEYLCQLALSFLSLYPASSSNPTSYDTPLYHYTVTHSGRPRRNLSHLVIGTWNSKQFNTSTILDLLEPLREFYLNHHPDPTLDNFGSSPESGRYSKYSFNFYPSNGYLMHHRDPICRAHPHAVLLTLRNSDAYFQINYPDYSLNYGKTALPVGTALVFDSSYSHAVLPCPLGPSSTSCEFTRIDCSYVNVDLKRIP